MIEVKQNTKQAQQIVHSYERLKSIFNAGIFGLYNKPSAEKIGTYDNCIARASKLGTIKDIKGCGGTRFYTLYIGVQGADENYIIQETYANTRILKGVML